MHFNTVIARESISYTNIVEGIDDNITVDFL